MKKIIFLLLIFTIVSVPYSFAMYIDVSPGSSDSMDLDWNNGYDNVSGFQIIEYDWTDNGTTTHDNYTLAGQFDLTFKENQNGPALFQSFGYCLDVTRDADDGIADLDPVSSSYYLSAWLVDTYAGNYQSGDDELKYNAGLQVAIWDAVHGDSFTPVFTEYSSYQTYYNRFTSSLPTDFSSFSFEKYRVVNFSDADHQDMITTVVPEPASMLLLGIGLLGLAGIGRKKKK